MSLTPPPSKPSSPETGLTGRKIIYDADGKPCRSCNTLLDFQFATGKIDSKKTTLTKANPSISKNKTPGGLLFGLIPGSRTYRKVPPPREEQIGHDSWTLLHSVVANYGSTPNDDQQKEMTRFLELFGKVYPVKEHGDSMVNYMKNNPINATNRNTLSQWLSGYHNNINKQLGKESFDFKFWEDRWVNGWE